MWVRIQEYSFAPDLADAVIERIRDTAVARYDGESHRGFRLLMDRPNGRALDVSYWDSLEGAHSEVGVESAEPVHALGAVTGATNYYELALNTAVLRPGVVHVGDPVRLLTPDETCAILADTP